MGLVLLIACLRGAPVPVVPLAPADAPPEPADGEQIVAWLLQGDPLGRRPRALSEVGASLRPGLADWRAVSTSSPDAAAWWRLEADHRGTLAVPLARGARLAEAEINLGNAERLVRALAPLPDPLAVPGAELRAPLSWLSSDTEGTLLVLERAVVTGWLDASADAPAASAALDGPAYDRLRHLPAVALLAARTRGARDAERGARAATRLRDALAHALADAAADRDREQAAMRARRADVLTAYPGATDATAALLADAEALATADAGADASLAVALTAQAMQRWRGTCPDLPCGGFDRIAMIDTAASLDPALRGQLAAWWVVMWKEALDSLDASWEYPTVVRAMDQVTELAASRGARAMDWTLLHRTRPDATVLLGWCRALGLPEATSREGAGQELGRYLERIAQNAIPVAPEASREPLARIARRALE